RLSALDAAFLNLESEHEPMHVAGLYIFEGRPEIPGRPGVPGLFQTVEERLHLVPRYRQRVQKVPLGLGHPVWVDDPDFDLAYHLRRLALPRPGGKKELLEVVARLHSRILDRSRPLWEMYIIEGLQRARVAIYFKTHHAMVDGISAVDVATILLDFDATGWKPERSEPFRPPPRLPTPAELVGDVVKETTGAIMGTAGRLLQSPARAPRALVGGALQATQLRDLLSMLRPVPTGPLNTRVGGARRIELVDVPLCRVKAIKDVLGGSVNDVFLTAVGEAINAFLVHRGEDVGDALTYRVMVPVSMRDESDRLALGNRLAAMFANIPVGRMPARKRLQMVTRQMKQLKQKQQASVADQLVALTSSAPAPLHALASRLGINTQRMVNLVVSNVPGVDVPVYAGGARLLQAYPLLPVAANLSVVVCVASYNGGMYFGVVGDYHGFPDLDVLAGGIEGGIENLERAAGVRPPKQVARAERSGGLSGQARRQATNGAHRLGSPGPSPARVSGVSVREAAQVAAAIAEPVPRRQPVPV
ncbi:MAG TPA: wax ester/triacylglycerol synthase family O-acyltransferase, partial [Candidatus Dormibacteraeota bacterium]|nr:wax ester/triacylglycerol synthase family O-acyltransferase [Candidatus Dormibacteraeota bacterium]